jgi:hypothetical protein
MVTFELHRQSQNQLIYWYYPEGKKDKRPGVIAVDLEKEKIEVTELAEDDFSHSIDPCEANEFVDSFNKTAEEEGLTDRLKKISKPIINTIYGGMAVHRIADLINQGTIPESGMNMWY